MRENWVIKIGSSLVTKKDTGLDVANIRNWAKQVNELVQNKINVIIVSSGAIAEGMNRLNLSRRPKSSSELQALASIGQMGLVQAYEAAFKKYNILTAQMLLTHEDLSSRERYLNAKNTLNNLINFNVIPNSGSVISNYLKIPKKDLCSALRSQIIAMYGGKEKRQLYCDFKSNLNDNINTSLKIVHDGRLPNQHLIQYQFKINNDLITSTLGCFKNNCNLMEKDLLKIISSISY